MKRLVAKEKYDLHDPTWPTHESKKGAHLFDPRPRFRHIVVMIDAHLLTATPSRLATRAALLTSLLEVPLVRCYRYADNGPPPSVEPDADQWGGQLFYDGWVVVQPDTDPAARSWGVTYTYEGHLVQSAVHNGGHFHFAREDVTIAAYQELPLEVARIHRFSDALAAQVASSALGADLYITEREYVHEAGWHVARGVTVCTPEEALPLVGLYLRAQGRHHISARHTHSRRLFFDVAVHELLPQGWRWEAACAKYADAVGDFDFYLLAESVLGRFERTLEARDGVHVSLDQPQDDQTRAQMLEHFDDILIDVMGAFDGIARVAHRALGLDPTKQYYA
ncbi:MAG: hypothetical protein QOD30_1368, partial [Actinomycetota bacterium]|nr:hypothetical protein [Actinomycetota bacterium]